MGRQSEHIIDRDLYYSQKQSISLKSAYNSIIRRYLDDDAIQSSKELNDYISAYKKTISFIADLDITLPKKDTKCDTEVIESLLLLKKDMMSSNEDYGASFHQYDNEEYAKIHKAFKYLNILLDFNVCSDNDYKKTFGNDSLEKIYNEIGISTFKDNINDRCSDKVTIFNASTFYSIERIRTINKESHLPFNILNSYFINELDKITLCEDKAAFLISVYKKLQELYSDEHKKNSKLFSLEFMILYRAYDRYYSPAENVITALKKTEKKLDEAFRNTKNDEKESIPRKKIIVSDYALFELIRGNSWKETKNNQKDLIHCIDNHIDDLEKRRSDLLSFIIQIIPKILDNERAAWEIIDANDLLHSIHKDFNSRRTKPKKSFSFEEALFYINQMSSSEQIVNVTESLFCLYSIEDDFVKTQFISIIQHLLADITTIPIKNYSSEDTAFFFTDKDISEGIVFYFFDLFFRIGDISDLDRDIINKLIKLSKTDTALFDRIHSMLVGFNLYKKGNS